MNSIRFITLIAALSITSFAFGQATPSSRIGWAQNAPTLAIAQGYTYKYYMDSSTTGVTLSSVTCSNAASPFLCVSPFPTVSTGSHSIQLTASNSTGESPKSPSFSFTYNLVVPASPAVLRILP